MRRKLFRNTSRPGLCRCVYAAGILLTGVAGASTADPTDVDRSITIYNQDYGIVRQTLPLNLAPGVNHIVYNDLTSRLVPSSVILRDPSGKLQFRLPGIPLFPSIPPDSILKPTLDWQIQTDTAGPLNAALSYETGGLTWSADYNLVEFIRAMGVPAETLYVYDGQRPDMMVTPGLADNAAGDSLSLPVKIRSITPPETNDHLYGSICGSKNPRPVSLYEIAIVKAIMFDNMHIDQLSFKQHIAIKTGNRQ